MMLRFVVGLVLLCFSLTDLLFHPQLGSVPWFILRVAILPLLIWNVWLWYRTWQEARVQYVVEVSVTRKVLIEPTSRDGGAPTERP
jgi:hypothetical protein